MRNHDKQVVNEARPYVRYDILCELLLFIGFTVIYYFLNKNSFPANQFTYTSFPALCVKLENINIYDCVRGFKNWSAIDPGTYYFIKDSIETGSPGTFIGHPIYMPFLVIAYNLFVQFFPDMRFATTSHIAMTLLSAYGLVCFFQMLRISGKDVRLSLFGAVILGMSYFYRNYAKADTGMWSLFSVVFMFKEYFLLIKNDGKILSVIRFGVACSFALLFYMTPLVVLPGIVISYFFIEKRVAKILQFLLLLFLTGLFCANWFYGMLYKYIDQFYGNNIHRFHCENFWDNLGYVILLMRTEGGLRGGVTQVVTEIINNIARFFVCAPERLYFPVGILILYGLLWIITMKFSKDKEKYFIAMLCVAAFQIAYMFIMGVYYPKQIMIIIPIIIYFMVEGLYLSSRGYFNPFVKPVVKRGILIAFISILLGMTLFDYVCPSANAYFSNRSDIFNSSLFSQLDLKLKKNSIVLYDSSYIGPDFGDAICSQTNLLSEISSKIRCSTTDRDHDFLLENFMKGRHPAKFYMLSVRGDVDVILVPIDKNLSGYLIFSKKDDIDGKWFIYECCGERAERSTVFVASDREPELENTRKIYNLKDVYWKPIKYKNNKALAMVPIGNDVIKNSEYRKSKSLIYW